MKKVLIGVVLTLGVIASVWGFTGLEKAHCDDCAVSTCSEDSECPGENCYCDSDTGQCSSF